MRHLPQLPLENKSMPIASHPKMKMWGQEELLRCWVGQRNHKSDFGETNPILPQAQETKTHLSAMTIYFRKKPIPFSLRFPKDRSSEFCKTKPIPRAESKIEN